MPTSFTSTGISGNYKSMLANHRKWNGAVLANGESWPRFFNPTATSSSDIVRLGIIPTYALTAPTTTASGTSSAGTYGIVLVYRASNYHDGLSLEDIQGNGSNVVDVTLTSAQAAVLTKVTTTDAKVDKLDVYAALKINGVYGTFYRVVKDGANSAGTITFNIQQSTGFLIGAGVTNGTADTAALVLAEDNDYPMAQPFIVQIGGRLISAGGIILSKTATFVNGNGTVTLAETVYDGIEFWFLKRDSDTTGGFDGRGTYLCRYASSTTVSLVNEDGTADTYDGSSGSGATTIWTEPNRQVSKLLNPHAIIDINNDYKSGILAVGKVPNTSRLLLMGRDWVVAEDYDRFPLPSGLNTISDTFGCSSPFSVVAAHGRLYWLDFGKGNREICMSDGTGVVPISTSKIKSVLDRLTLDANGDVWRVGFIPGAFYKKEDCIRWFLYLDNNTVSTYALELDMSTGEMSFYPHRMLDVFTTGEIRGNVYVGQYGWTGGIARMGQDNVNQRYRDWVEGGTLSGSLATSGQTTTVLTPASGTLYTTGEKLKGVNAMIWRESDASGNLIANPTFYHCRISNNTSSTFTINYVETMNIVGEVSAVGAALPSAPSGSGWKWAVGVIQSIIGPKWVAAQDGRSSLSLKELSAIHRGQATAAATNPIMCHTFENFDNQAKDCQRMDRVQAGQQIADTTKFIQGNINGKANPSTVIGFGLIDNNVSTDTTALNIEAIVLDVEQDKK